APGRHPGGSREDLAGRHGRRSRAHVTTGLHRPSDIQLERIAYRRRQTIRSVLVAAFSTAVVGVLLYVAVTGAPGWERVKTSFFNPEIAREFLPAVLEGLWLNVRMLVVCA